MGGVNAAGCVGVAVAVAGILLGDALQRRTASRLCKVLASAGFVVLALLNGPTSNAFSMAMMAGLILGAVGDVLLLLPGPTPFLLGLGTFLLGHVAYGVAFWVRGQDARAAALAVVPLVAVAVPVLRWLMPHVRGRLRGPVLAYVAVINFMVALAVGTVFNGAPAGFFGAALAFYVSDLFVARERFVAPGALNRAVGLPMYYTSQLLLALQVNG